MFSPPLCRCFLNYFSRSKGKNLRCVELKIFVCDFIDPTVNQLDSFVVEAEEEDEAKLKAIEELKTLGIPKRYILKLEEVL